MLDEELEHCDKPCAHARTTQRSASAVEITATGPIGRGMLAPASLSLERVQFTGGCSATSCEDLIRAVLMFIGRWRPRPGGSRRLLCAAVVVQLGPACVSCTREQHI